MKNIFPKIRTELCDQGHELHHVQVGNLSILSTKGFLGTCSIFHLFFISFSFYSSSLLKLLRALELREMRNFKSDIILILIRLTPCASVQIGGTFETELESLSRLKVPL